MAQNKHLEHLEDNLLNNGVQGAQISIKMLEDLGKFLSSDTSNNLQITTKFDGAPAIVCGTDPEDGKFFVGTKSVFNTQEPKINKTREDILQNHRGTLASKLIVALQCLPSCGINGVLQGDMMFTDDKTTRTINNKSNITFTPNTITYAAETSSPLGRKISAARLGIVFHTKYSGNSIPTMSASFDVSDKDFKSSSSVWAQRATFQNIGGRANFSSEEKRQYNAMINKAKGSLSQAGKVMNDIQTGKKTLGIDTEFKKFFNNYVKLGTGVPNVESAYSQFFYHLGKEYDKPIQKLKRLESQANKAGQYMDAVDYLMQHKQEVKMLIATYMNLQSAKMMVVRKLNQIESIGSFVRQPNGDYKSTAPEGFVAISAGGATKLVDRLEFSRLNFTIPKNWG